MKDDDDSEQHQHQHQHQGSIMDTSLHITDTDEQQLH